MTFFNVLSRRTGFPADEIQVIYNTLSSFAVSQDDAADMTENVVRALTKYRAARAKETTND